jgi:phospholipid/cholesterol/gamma-HCH transport system substrate-binding protein
VQLMPTRPQSGLFARLRRSPGRLLDDRAAAARSRRNGLIGIVLIVASVVVTVAAYFNPINQNNYTAHASTSGGLRSGDEIRIAGVGVGEVTSVRLDRNVVEIKFEVKQSVAVGSESTLDIKLLTPVGGHYIALDPEGPVPLGHNVIPTQHVKAAFETTDLLQAVTPLVRDINGQVLHDTFSQVANVVNKYPNALRDTLNSANELTRYLSKMDDDLHRGLGFVNDAVGSLAGEREQLIGLIDELALVGQRYTTKSVDIIEFFTLLKELTRMVDRIMVFYSREVPPSVNDIDDIFDTLFTHPDRIGNASQGLGQILNIMTPTLSGNGVAVDENRRMTPGQDLCLPNIARRC